MQIDYRSVYTSISNTCFQMPQATLNQLLGQAFLYVPVIGYQAAGRAGYGGRGGGRELQRVSQPHH